MATLDLEKSLKRGTCVVCNKKGCHKACVTCLVAYHNHCGHVCPSAAPSSQQAPPVSPDPPAAPAQPPSNEDPPADEDPPASHAACGGKCGHRDASSGQCGCTEEICGCGYRFKAFQPLRSQVSYHQRLVEAIRTNNVPRVATVLNAAKKRGYGLKRLVGLVEDAATANRTRYSVDEKDLCVLLYRAGGPSVCHALSQAHLLPSLSHCRGLAKKDTIPLSSEFSFASCFQAWSGKPAIGLTEHRDDIFLNPRLSLGKSDMIEGLCECAPPKRFEALADLHEVMEKLQSGEWPRPKSPPYTPQLTPPRTTPCPPPPPPPEF